MTGKRFTYWEEPNGEFPFPYILTPEGKEISNLHEACLMLNTYHEGNNTIKRTVDSLKEENNELKFQLEECRYNKLFSRRELEKENKELKEQLKDCTKKAKEEIMKQEEENAIRWANIGW